MNPGRNDPCPCGSGKKFKRCCGANGAPARAGTPVLAQQERTLNRDAFDAGENGKSDEDRRLEEAQHNYEMANALVAQGKLDHAIAHYERAISLKPDFAEAHNNLGNTLVTQGRSDLAVAHFERALALMPDARVHYNLGNILRRSSPIRAISHYQQAIALQPDVAEVHNSLAVSLVEQGEIDQAITHYERALSLKPDFAAAHSNLLHALHYSSSKDPAAVYQAHLEYAKQVEAPLVALKLTHSNERSFKRRLKIGYVSSDLRQHSVAHFIEPVLEKTDRDRFEIFCYSNHSQEDEVTKRLQSYSDHWRNIFRVADDLVASQIRNDQIDILIDLNGHTARNRLPLFARKPAPIQVTWLGYPNTTGLSTMDYRLTDGVADPCGMTEHLHSEKLIRLPECFSCFKQPRDAPAVSRLPALEKGYINFASFNNHAKITPEVMSAWAAILRATPGSRLTLKSAGMGENAMQRTVRNKFAALDIAPARLELLGHDRSQSDHLARYRTVDIALDPFPYNGVTTTCEALWMGIPVVVLAGKTHAGRVGASLLSHLGLKELICQTIADYVDTATRLVSDLEHLAQLRRELRTRMMLSPLLDARRFTDNLEQAYLAMWKNYIGERA